MSPEHITPKIQEHEGGINYDPLHKSESQNLQVEIQQIKNTIQAIEEETLNATMDLNKAKSFGETSKIGALQNIIEGNNTRRAQLNLELIKKENELRIRTAALDDKYAVSTGDIWQGRDTDRRSH